MDGGSWCIVVSLGEPWMLMIDHGWLKLRGDCHHGGTKSQLAMNVGEKRFVRVDHGYSRLVNRG